MKVLSCMYASQHAVVQIACGNACLQKRGDVLRWKHQDKEVQTMKLDSEKVLRKQREKKAAIILAARRREKAAARYAGAREEDVCEKCAGKCAKRY